MDPAGVDWTAVLGGGGAGAVILGMFAWFLRRVVDAQERIPVAIEKLAVAQTEAAVKVAAEHKAEVLALQCAHAEERRQWREDFVRFNGSNP